MLLNFVDNKPADINSRTKNKFVEMVPSICAGKPGGEEPVGEEPGGNQRAEENKERGRGG